MLRIGTKKFLLLLTEAEKRHVQEREDDGRHCIRLNEIELIEKEIREN